MKKLLIITGAGGSVEFGMPSVTCIDDLFDNWAKALLPLTDDPNANLYSWVKEKLKSHIARNPNNREGAILNFESILFTLQNLAELAKDEAANHYNHRLVPFIDIKPFPSVRNSGREKIADGNDFSFLHSNLVDRLLTCFREKCKTLATDKDPELQQLRSFLTALKKEFDLGIINLNYDNVILSALPDLKTGFNRAGEFDRSQLYQADWNFCYHMHGSVHFDMKSNQSVPLHRVFWNNDLQSTFASNSSGRNGNFTGEGMVHLNSNIITGLDKANQILKEPFAQYFMQVDRLIYEADSILFIGYGFNDWHLNRLFSFIRYDKAKLRKVVVLDYTDEKGEGLSYRHDGWQFGLFNTVPYNAREMGGAIYSEPESANYFKRQNIFEKSSNPDYPLSLWYNGLLKACQFPEKYIQELR